MTATRAKVKTGKVGVGTWKWKGQSCEGTDGKGKWKEEEEEVHVLRTNTRTLLLHLLFLLFSLFLFLWVSYSHPAAACIVFFSSPITPITSSPQLLVTRFTLLLPSAAASAANRLRTGFAPLRARGLGCSSNSAIPSTDALVFLGHLAHLVYLSIKGRDPCPTRECIHTTESTCLPHPWVPAFQSSVIAG